MEIVMKSANSKLRPLTVPLPSDHSAERWLLRAKEREREREQGEELKGESFQWSEFGGGSRS